MEEGKVANGDVQLHYVADGPSDGEPVLLLHGFPEYSYGWRYQMKALADAGYRAVAPDLRGYNLSDRPEGVAAYAMQNLVGDVAAFFKAFGWSQANLVAHDWGGAIAWVFAAYNQALLKKFVVIDLPHPAAFREAQRTNLTQLQRSWYMWFFQSPDAPEKIFGGDNIDFFMRWVFDLDSDRKIFTPEDIAHYRQMLSQPGQLTAAINYYRANSTPSNLVSDQPVKLPLIKVPTLLLYGEEDFAFAPEVWEKCAAYCNGPYQAVGLPGKSHWLPEEAHEEVSRLILEHLQK